jgi:septal ring factor EnvC (AmiA/AmiB activator)
MQRTPFWTRVGSWFRPGIDPAPPGGNLNADPGDPSPEAFERFEPDADESAATARGPLATMRRRPREEALGRLEEGFQRIAKLCDSLDVHFTLQEERTAQISDSLKQVAGDMSKLADSVGSQGQTLNAIAAQLETGNKRNDRLEELCGHFSKMTEAQRQSLAQVGQQIDAARQSDAQIVESLGTFRDAMTSLGDTCSASTDALRDIRMDAARNGKRLTGLIEQQAKRFVWLFIVTLVVALAGIGSFVFGVLR